MIPPTPGGSPTLLELLDLAAYEADRLAKGRCVTGEWYRAAAERLASEMKALELRSKDKRDPLTDHAFCALNALLRINGGDPR